MGMFDFFYFSKIVRLIKNDIFSLTYSKKSFFWLINIVFKKFVPNIIRLVKTIDF